MATPICFLIKNCTQNKSLGRHEDKILNAAFALDVAATITAIVIGVLGLLGIMSLSTAASYALLGFAGVQTLLFASVCLYKCVTFIKGRCEHGKRVEIMKMANDLNKVK